MRFNFLLIIIIFSFLGRSPARRKDVRSCNRLYASLAFSILSPDHPENYPSDVECKYTIRRLGPRICRLMLSFRAFDVESSEGCEYDYFEIDGQKLCGTLPQGHTREYRNMYYFSFQLISLSAYVNNLILVNCQIIISFIM